MHTSSLSNQIRLARTIGVPASKIDRFVAYTRKRPVHSIIDLEKILKRMKLNTKQINTIANAYLTQVVGSSPASSGSKSTVRNIVKNFGSSNSKKTLAPEKPRKKLINNIHPNAANALRPLVKEHILAHRVTNMNAAIRSIVDNVGSRKRLQRAIPGIPLRLLKEKKEDLVRDLKTYATTGTIPSAYLKRKKTQQQQKKKKKQPKPIIPLSNANKRQLSNAILNTIQQLNQLEREEEEKFKAAAVNPFAPRNFNATNARKHALINKLWDMKEKAQQGQVSPNIIARATKAYTNILNKERYRILYGYKNSDPQRNMKRAFLSIPTGNTAKGNNNNKGNSIASTNTNSQSGQRISSQNRWNSNVLSNNSSRRNTSPPLPPPPPPRTINNKTTTKKRIIPLKIK